MLNEEEQVIDVEAVEVQPQETTELSIDNEEFQVPDNPYDQYVDFKKQTYKYKQLQKVIKNNIKAQRGFGYTHQEVKFN